MTDLSRDEFYRAIDGLKTDLTSDIGGIHDRLDTLNGRTGKGEVERAELKQRIVSVEKEVFRRRHGERSSSGGAQSTSRLSKKDTGLAALGVGLAFTAVKLFILLGEFVLEIGKAALHKGGT